MRKRERERVRKRERTARNEGRASYVERKRARWRDVRRQKGTGRWEGRNKGARK